MAPTRATRGTESRLEKTKSLRTEGSRGVQRRRIGKPAPKKTTTAAVHRKTVGSARPAWATAAKPAQIARNSALKAVGREVSPTLGVTGDSSIRAA
jgi:hypothetical protein